MYVAEKSNPGPEFHRRPIASVVAQKPSGRLTATHFSPYINIYDLL